MTTGKTIALTIWTFVSKVLSLLFNMLSRLVIAFFLRSKRLLIAWLQSPTAVIHSVAEKSKVSHCFHCFPIYLPWSDGTEKAMAPHSSTLAWKIPWTEEPGRLQSMGSWRVSHDWVTSLSLLCIGEGNGNPLQSSCLENPRDGVAQSPTRLKWLSSNSRWDWMPWS